MGSQSQHGATPQPQSFDPLVGSNETKLRTPRSDESHDQKNYDEKYLDMNHFFKSGTHTRRGKCRVDGSRTQLGSTSVGTSTAAPTKQASTTIDDMPTVIMTHIVGLAEGANPFVLTPVSHGFMTAVDEYVNSIYEAEERLHAIETMDRNIQLDTQRTAHAASPSLRDVCAQQIQEAAMRFLARRRRSVNGVELEISSAAPIDANETTVRVQINGGANTSLFVSPLVTARATRTGSTTPLGLAGKGQHLPTQGDLRRVGQGDLRRVGQRALLRLLLTRSHSRSLSGPPFRRVETLTQSRGNGPHTQPTKIEIRRRLVDTIVQNVAATINQKD